MRRRAGTQGGGSSRGLRLAQPWEEQEGDALQDGAPVDEEVGRREGGGDVASASAV